MADRFARFIILFLATSGVLFCGTGFRETPLPTMADGVADGFLDFVVSLGMMGVVSSLPFAAGLFLGLAVLAGALHRELLVLITDWSVISWGHRLVRTTYAGGPLGVFVYYAVQWLAVFVASLLIMFAIMLIVSALRNARLPG